MMLLYSLCFIVAAYSERRQTSKTESLVKITIFAKHSILDVWRALNIYWKGYEYGSAQHISQLYEAHIKLIFTYF